MAHDRKEDQAILVTCLLSGLLGAAIAVLQGVFAPEGYGVFIAWILVVVTVIWVYEKITGFDLVRRIPQFSFLTCTGSYFLGACLGYMVVPLIR